MRVLHSLGKLDPIMWQQVEKVYIADQKGKVFRSLTLGDVVANNYEFFKVMIQMSNNILLRLALKNEEIRLNDDNYFAKLPCMITEDQYDYYARRIRYRYRDLYPRIRYRYRDLYPDDDRGIYEQVSYKDAVRYSTTLWLANYLLMVLWCSVVMV
jgi:hypothetical protein